MFKLLGFFVVCCIAGGLRGMDSETAGLDMTITTTSGSTATRTPAK